LVIDRAPGNDYTISVVISGTGTVEQKGANVLTLSGANNYNGVTTVTAGTLKVGNATALGGTLAGTTIADGGTLDLNGFSFTAEQFTAQGPGVDGKGAIINSNTQQSSSLRRVTLSGNTSFGGSNYWRIYGLGSSLSTNGNSYNLTKVGSNQILIFGTVDAALADININEGFLGLQAGIVTMGDPSKTVTIASGATLYFDGVSRIQDKKCVLNGGTIWAEFGAGAQNTFTGHITVNSSGGIFDAGGALTGGTPNADAVLNLSGPITGDGNVTKNGPGTVFITGTPGYDGQTTINDGTLQIDTGLAVSLHAVTGAGTLGVDNATSLTVDSINLGTLTIGAGSTVTIAPIPSGPLAESGSLSGVPEPSILILLGVGVSTFLAHALQRRRWTV
jgi:autotransporter-associated beta strand protein